MQFTLEQYTSLLALIGAVMIFGFFSYHCGLKDRAEKIKEAECKAERARTRSNDLQNQLTIIEHRADTNARAIELLNDELEASNLVKRRQLAATLDDKDTIAAYEKLSKEQQKVIDQLIARLITVKQRKTISQAASQLLMTAQVMEAMQNQASAKTQRALAGQLQNIISDTAAPKTLDEAA